jgi:hypothetical protein
MEVCKNTHSEQRIGWSSGKSSQGKGKDCRYSKINKMKNKTNNTHIKGGIEYLRFMHDIAKTK